MKINQRKAGVLLSYTLTVTNALVGFIYIPLLIHFLGKEEYGLFQLMGSVLIYLSLFDFGLSSTVTRFYSKYIALKNEKAKENILALSTGIYIFLTLLLLIVGISIYFFLNDIFSYSLTGKEIETVKSMYIIILITVAITISTSVFNSIITSNERFIFLRVLSIIQTIMRPIIVFAVFSIESSALILVIIQAVINIIAISIKIYFSFKKLNVRIKFHYFDKALIKEMVRYSFFIFITVLMDQIFWRSDQVILGVISGTASVAVYSISSQIIIYYMTLSTAMSGVFLPNITKKVMNKTSNGELTAIMIKVGRLQYILLGAVTVGFVLFGKEFISIWVGTSFIQSYSITLIIMIPFTIDLIQNIGLTILQAKNMYSFRATVFFCMAILNVILSIPLALKYGGIGTATATGVSYFIGNGVIMNYYYYKKVGLDIFSFWKEIGKLSLPLATSFVLGILINELSTESQFLSFLLKIVLFMILFIIVIWNFGLNKYERGLIIMPMNAVVKRIKSIALH